MDDKYYTHTHTHTGIHAGKKHLVDFITARNYDPVKSTTWQSITTHTHMCAHKHTHTLTCTETHVTYPFICSHTHPVSQLPNENIP